MKLKCVFILILAVVCGTTFAGELELRKSIIPFYITKRATDATLQGNSKFNFTFNASGKEKNATIDFGMNEATSVLETNGQGIAIKNTVPGKYVLYFYLPDHFEVISDTVEIKKNEVIDAQIYLQKADVIITVDKPVIYLYPEKETKVEVKIEGGDLGFTYPNYEDGWNFTAQPDGKLNFENKKYNYLFYESDVSPLNFSLNKNISTGFLVATDTLLPFLESSLSKMGFTAAESADFITFWYPQMMVNDKNYIRFLFNEECNVYGELKISPAPETIFRLGMIWSTADGVSMPIQKQELPSFERNGFTVVEWGGAEVDAAVFF